jgi:hypothetical protein
VPDWLAKSAGSDVKPPPELRNLVVKDFFCRCLKMVLVDVKKKKTINVGLISSFAFGFVNRLLRGPNLIFGFDN